MKIINVDINDEIIFKNVLDTDTGVITGISSSVKLPTGNYNNIILNFSFANQKLCDKFNIFASFKINNGTPIVQELVPIAIGDVTYAHTCYIPNEVFQDKCEVTLGVYGYRLNEDGTLAKRFSLVPVRNFVIEGSYDPEGAESITPTPTVFEVYFEKIDTAIDTLDDMMNEFLEYYKKYESTYITTSANETVIPVNIPVLNSATLLLVFINELYVPATNYTIDYESRKIKLNTAIATVGTKINFVCLKTVVANPEDYSKLKGEQGVSPTISVNTNTDTEYTLDITDINGTITTPNLKGGGEPLSETGEEIIINSPVERQAKINLGGNIEQDSRSGKNLLNIEDGKTTNCTKSINGNSITLTSTQSTGGFCAYTCEFPAKPNTKYYLQSKSTRTGNGGGGIIVQVRKSDDTTSNNLINKRNELNAGGVFTTPSDTVNIRVYLYACGDTGTETATQSATFTDVQVEEGSVATEYEAYGVQPSPDYPSEIRSVSGDVEVKAEGKNLFNINGDVNTRYNGATSDKNKVSGNSLTTTHNWGTGHGYGQRIYVGKGNTVTYSAKFTALGEGTYTDEVTIAELCCYNDNNNTKFDLPFRAKEIGIIKSKQFTAQTDYIYLTFGAYTVRTASVTFTDIQLEIGTTATPYEPYKGTIVSLPLGDIELRSTPDEKRDTFVRIDGLWNKRNNVAHEIKDGSSNYLLRDDVSTADGFYTFRDRGYEKTGVFNSNSAGLSNYFEVVQTATYNKNNIRFVDNYYYGIQITIDGNIAKTPEELKTWLDAHPLDVIYPLATPTYTPITDTALISALDELEELILHKGYNRIYTETVNGVHPILELDAPATADNTFVEETNSTNEHYLTMVSGSSNRVISIPQENRPTIIPSTGEVNVKALKINGVDITAYVDQAIATAISNLSN